MRAAAFLCLATLAIACSVSDHPGNLSSNACGGFHLKVVNGLSQGVRLTIDADWMDVVDAGGTETVTQFLTQPKPPPLPWIVEIYDATGRVTLFRQTMNGSADQQVTLTDGVATATPYGTADESC